MVQEAIVGGGQMPSGVTAGLIILFHKGGGRCCLNSCLNITLLNTAYKVFAKALQRLQPVLMEVVSLDQSSFLSMRFILDNIFLTNETIHHAKKTSQPLVFSQARLLQSLR